MDTLIFKDIPYTWKIVPLDDKSFQVETRVLYINNLGQFPGAFENEVTQMKKFVLKYIPIENLEDELNLRWEQIDSFHRKIELKFTLKSDIKR